LTIFKIMVLYIIIIIISVIYLIRILNKYLTVAVKLVSNDYFLNYF